MCVLANAVVFTSKGTSFMLSGEEFLRTKGGDSNSYQSPDSVNALDYSLKIKNEDVFRSYQALIAFKQDTAALQTASGGIDVEVLDGGSVLEYSFKSGNASYIVIHANGGATGAAIEVAGYTVVLDTLGQLTGQPGTVSPAKYQTIILKK